MVTITEDTAIISAIFTVIELRYLEKHKNVDISMKLFEWAQEGRLRKTFRWVGQEFQLEKYEKAKAEGKISFEMSDYPNEVASFFEQVGFLVEKKFVDFDVIEDHVGSYIISNWRKLEPWIMDLGKERNDNTFGKHFQKLYEKTVDYMRKHE